MGYQYTTNFRLTFPVNDYDEARHYLVEDDMTKYLRGDSRIPQGTRDAVEHIQWNLRDDESGSIDLETREPLLPEELDAISNWVRGQNSDGLGEGFEQQEFAEYHGLWAEPNEWDYDDYDEYYDAYYEWETNCAMAEFDWDTNEYKFREARRSYRKRAVKWQDAGVSDPGYSDWGQDQGWSISKSRASICGYNIIARSRRGGGCFVEIKQYGYCEAEIRNDFIDKPSWSNQNAPQNAIVEDAVRRFIKSGFDINSIASDGWVFM